MLSASAISISTTLASPKTARETSSMTCVMRDGTHGAQKSSRGRNSGLGVDSRRALFDRANHLVQRAKHLHQPAAHLGALLESQAVERTSSVRDNGLLMTSLSETLDSSIRS